MDLTQKKEIILCHELAFADSIGSAVLDKPKVSTWMIFIPIFFLFFIYRMKKFKKDRAKFLEEFMKARRDAMDIALDSAAEGGNSLDGAVQVPDLPEPLQKPYVLWIQTLSSHYLDMLTADGEDFGSLVCAAYRNRSNYMLVLNRLNSAEKDFYAALKPYLASVEGAFDISARIEAESRRLRSDKAGSLFVEWKIFPG